MKQKTILIGVILMLTVIAAYSMNLILDKP